MKQCYGTPLPGLDLEDLSGLLVVLEGSDSSGRSTQVGFLSKWLEQRGFGVVQVGLTRSKLFGPALHQAKQGNVLSPRTMSLFYATDFYDQLENVIVPSLKAGFIVLADRYIYTLMARDLVRGARSEWVLSLYSKALVPDAVYFLMASSSRLAERTLNAHQTLDYWESGMDIGISRDWYESFIRYQRMLRAEYNKLQEQFGFEIVNANRSVSALQKDLRRRIEVVLESYGS